MLDHYFGFVQFRQVLFLRQTLLGKHRPYAERAEVQSDLANAEIQIGKSLHRAGDLDGARKSAQTACRLLAVLERLVASGNTVLVIEHNLDVIKTADWIIDLGPEGGDAGGRVVVAGSPEAVAAHPTSYTGAFLSEVLGMSRREASEPVPAPA